MYSNYSLGLILHVFNCYLMLCQMAFDLIRCDTLLSNQEQTEMRNHTFALRASICHILLQDAEVEVILPLCGVAYSSFSIQYNEYILGEVASTITSK